MDMLSELAYGITPYRYGFNNPIVWQDRTGLFESYLDARYYQLSHGLFGRSSIEYDNDSGTWSINTGKSMITQIGDWIVTTYELDGGGIGADWNKAGGGSNSNSNSSSSNNSNKEGDPGYNPNGIIFSTHEGRESPVTQSRGPREAWWVKVNFIQFILDILGTGTTVPSELNYERKKTNSPYKPFVKEKPLTKDQEKMMKIQFKRFQQADRWEKKDYSIPHVQYDTMIREIDRPKVLQKMIDDSLKYVK